MAHFLAYPYGFILNCLPIFNTTTLHISILYAGFSHVEIELKTVAPIWSSKRDHEVN